MIDLGSMTDKFSEAGQKLVRRAIEVSRSRDHNFLGLSHIFAAVADIESDLFVETMQAVGVDPDSVTSLLEEELTKSPVHVGRKMAIPEPTRDLFNRALRRARAQGRRQIESYDFFAALFTDPIGTPAEILRRLGVDPALATDPIFQPVRTREKLIESPRSQIRWHGIRIFKFSELTPGSLNSIATIKEKGLTPDIWDKMDLSLTDQERRQVEAVVSSLLNKPVVQMNEATIWSRAVYPLLVLAEQDRLEAWAQLPLKAKYPGFGLEGIADGVVGHNISGLAKSFCLVVVQVKHEPEAQDPLIQLYGEMLAAAGLNWAQDNRVPQEIYGCYTVADNWIFAHGLVADIEAPRPTMTVALSRAYSETVEAETVLRILKSITSKFAQEVVNLA
jgi:Clp amino terminal domain, pathogenicity island component